MKASVLLAVPQRTVRFVVSIGAKSLPIDVPPMSRTAHRGRVTSVNRPASGRSPDVLSQPAIPGGNHATQITQTATRAADSIRILCRRGRRLLFMG